MGLNAILVSSVVGVVLFAVGWLLRGSRAPAAVPPPAPPRDDRRLEEEKRKLTSVLDEANAREARAREEVARLEKRVRELEAAKPAEEPAPAPAPDAEGGGDLDAGLRRLTALGTVRTALVADTQGLAVACAGDDATRDGLAALAGPSQELVARAREFLSLGEVRLIQLRDAGGLVVTLRPFATSEHGFSLHIVGTAAISTEALDGAVAAVASALGG
jgi:hypothetical protein